MFRLAPRRGRLAATVVLAVALATVALAAAAIAAGFTLSVKKHASVTNMKTHKTTHANIVVNGKGFAVYALSGDSRTHPKCTTTACRQVWPPVTVKSAKKLSRSAAVRGKLGTVRRKGILQVTLNGHPLYTFVVDTKPGAAKGQGVVAFGGTWHVMLASGKPLVPSSGGIGGGY